MAEISTPHTPDRRRAPRYAWVRPMEWDTGTGITGNMSTTGLFFHTEVHLMRGAWLTFSLLSAAFSEEMRIYLHGRGQIVRLQPRDGQWGVGLHFAQMRFGGPSGGIGAGR